MLDFLSSYFIVDRRQTRIYFTNTYLNNEGETVYYDIIVPIETFISMFEEQIKSAMENGTDLMDEIKTCDPENKLGYNNLIL
jgi:hypothetical protein